MSSSPLHLPPPPITPTQTHLTEELFLNSSTCVSLLNSCANNRDQNLAACIHAGIWKSGLNANLYVNNSLLHIYAKCGNQEDATKVFEQMPERDVVSWTSLLSGHCHNGAADAALSVFNDMLLEESAPPPNEFTLAAFLQACAGKRDQKIGQIVHGLVITNGFVVNPFIHNCLIDMYSKSGSLVSVEKLICRSSFADVVSWTSAISGCVLHGLIEKALHLFLWMLQEGIMPNGVTMLSIIHACSLLNDPKVFGWVHSWVVKLDLQSDSFVVNSLVEMYSRNGVVKEALKIFCHFGTPDGNLCLTPEVMASLIQCCTLSFSLNLGEGIHGYLIKYGFFFFPCILVENSLLDLYAKTERVDSAYRLFSTMEDQDIVSWNTMISCFVKNSQSPKALQLLTQIHSKSGGVLIPDVVTLLSSIQACSEMAALQQGEILHGYVIRGGFGCDVFIGNALIDMYAKSGRIDFAERVFQDMNVKDLGSWNSMIAAYGNHGDGDSALRIFTQLKKCGTYFPSAITFVNIISACGHSGLTMEGYECFESMGRDYGIERTMEHYACMVDLLGRSGKLNEAMDFINEMPVSPGAAVWGSLLGACCLFGNVEIAERAAERLSILKPECQVWRVALSNVYSLAGRWELAAKTRAEVKSGYSRKEAGWSSVELREGESFRFMVADTRHPKSAEIYEVLNGIKEHIKDASLERF